MSDDNLETERTEKTAPEVNAIRIDEVVNNDIELVAESATIHVSEKVSTGEYENATFQMSLDVGIENVDCTEGAPSELRMRLKKLQRELHGVIRENSTSRRESANRRGGR